MLLPFAIAIAVGSWFAWMVISSYRQDEAAYRRAEAALVSGDYVEAVDAFAEAGTHRDAVERRISAQQLLKPVRAAYLDAITALELEDFDTAITLLEPIHESMPDFEDVSALLLEATSGKQRALEREVDLSVSQHNWMAADAALAQLVELYPEESRYLTRLNDLRNDHAPIIFARSGALMQIGPDGEDERLLFNEFRIASPQWSPNRRYITFFDESPSNAAITSLYLFDYNSGTVETISDWAAPDPIRTWNRDGSRLAFVINAATSDMKPSNRTKLAIFDLGSRTVEVAPLPNVAAVGHTELAAVTSPTWSPEGNRLAFVVKYLEPAGSSAAQVRRAEVFVADLSTGAIQNLTEGELPAVAYVTWSPARDELLIWETESGAAWFDSDETAIWVFDLEEGARRRLTERTETPGRPHWSPDGASFAVISGGQSLVVRMVDGSELLRAVSTSELSRVTWSPAGSSLLVIASTPGEPSMVVDLQSRADSQSPLRIDFDGGLTNLGPQWSAH